MLLSLCIAKTCSYFTVDCKSMVDIMTMGSVVERTCLSYIYLVFVIACFHFIFYILITLTL